MEGEGKLRKFLNTDLAVKIISLVLAVVVWIYVVILLDPAIDITLTDIPLIYTNSVNLSNDGYVLLNEKQSNVSLVIRGSRTMLAKINKSDIAAYIDLNGYNQTGSFSLPVSVRLPYDGISVVEKKPNIVNIQIDKLVTQVFPVTVEVKGEPSAGFMTYKPIASQSTVEIKGPNDVVTSIERVVASLDISGASNDVTGSLSPVCYNSNGDEVSSKFLSSFPEKLEVRCGIMKRKTVPVKAVFAGQGHEGDVLTNSSIIIFGKPEIIDNIIEIYTKPIDVAGITGNKRITAQLDMPENVFVLDDITEVAVDISVKSQ